MRFALTDQMIYAVFKDGDYVAVDDAEMGPWGGPTDFLTSGPGAIGPYKLFQESAPQVPVETIPKWSSQLRAYSADPQVLPTAWPSVVAGPG
jgi:hypothetical protein